jgi:hypothetical protein
MRHHSQSHAKIAVPWVAESPVTWNNPVLRVNSLLYFPSPHVIHDKAGIAFESPQRHFGYSKVGNRVALAVKTNSTLCGFFRQVPHENVEIVPVIVLVNTAPLPVYLA